MRRPWAEIVQERNDYILLRYKEGATFQTIADEVGISIATVWKICTDIHGKKRAWGKPRFPTPAMQQRLCEMIEMREAGKTLQQIGDHFGLTRERVRQCIGHIEVGTEKRNCRVCDQPFEAKKTLIVQHCGNLCFCREKLHGIVKARQIAKESADKKSHISAGEKKCVGACKQWLPTSAFTSALMKRCKVCADNDARERRKSVSRYSDERRNAMATAQQQRRERERQEAAT